jgi:hypothetical protein
MTTIGDIDVRETDCEGCGEDHLYKVLPAGPITQQCVSCGSALRRFIPGKGRQLWYSIQFNDSVAVLVCKDCRLFCLDCWAPSSVEWVEKFIRGKVA